MAGKIKWNNKKKLINKQRITSNQIFTYRFSKCERSTYFWVVIIWLEQLNLIFYAMKPAIIVQETSFCLLQTLANVLLLGT